MRSYSLILCLSTSCVYLMLHSNHSPWQQNTEQHGRHVVLRDNHLKVRKNVKKESVHMNMTSQFPKDVLSSLNSHGVTTDAVKTLSGESRQVPSKKQKITESLKEEEYQEQGEEQEHEQDQDQYQQQEQDQDQQQDQEQEQDEDQDQDQDQEQELEEEEEEDALSYDMKIREKKFQVLAEKYAINNTLIVAVTDLGYIEMALNLYLTSFKRFNIDNYLFVCSHEKAEQFLTSRNIHAISLWNDSLSTKESLYSGKGYRNKTNFKTDSVLMTLQLGLNAFLVDVDLVFLKNPMPYLSQFATTHDIIIQGGLQTLNSGKVNAI